jgi:hypothetical protein
MGVSFPAVSACFRPFCPLQYDDRRTKEAQLGTIVARKRQDGSSYYTAQIVIKQRGNVHREARSFDRKPAANAWIVNR